MDPEEASETAIRVALTRSIEYLYNPNPVFADSMAHLLVGEDGRERNVGRRVAGFDRDYPDRAATASEQEKLVVTQKDVPGPGLIVGRARFNEDRLEDGLAGGIKQYVIVGAGLDSFALRLGDSYSDVDIFEVDHPISQEFKRSRIAAIGLSLPANLHFAAADFEKDTLESALQRTAYDSTASAFFSWLGVTYYLTAESIQQTLLSIEHLASPGSQLVMDYFDAEIFKPENQSNRVQVMFQGVASVGEPFLTGFHPAELSVLLAEHGFEVDEDIGHEEMNERYYKDHPHGAAAQRLGRVVHARFLSS